MEYLYNGILSHIKDGNSDVYYNMDECKGYYASEISHSQRLHITYYLIHSYEVSKTGESIQTKILCKAGMRSLRKVGVKANGVLFFFFR